jgi:hypothetical protein
MMGLPVKIVNDIRRDSASQICAGGEGPLGPWKDEQ